MLLINFALVDIFCTLKPFARTNQWQCVEYLLLQRKMSMNKITNSDDLRVRRTRKLVWDALLELIIERGFESITVNTICDRAMVHRTTFYNHYQDKYDLLESGIQKMYAELTLQLTPPDDILTEHAHVQPADNLVWLFQHILDHRSFYTVMLDGEGVYPFRQRLQASIMELAMIRLTRVYNQQDTVVTIPAELVASFNVGAIMNALIWWIKSDYAMPPQALAQHVGQMIRSGSFSIFGESDPQ